MKRAFSLIEIILVLFISSIVLIYTFKFSKEFFYKQINSQKIAIMKIDMNSTRIFIEKRLPMIINQLRYDGKTLFYKNSILLEKVSHFKINKSTKFLKITINLDNSIKQIWEYKL